MPMPWLTCSDYAHVLSPVAHEAMGAAKHPAFPAPSSTFEGQTVYNNTRARMRRGTVDACRCSSERRTTTPVCHHAERAMRAAPFSAVTDVLSFPKNRDGSDDWARG